MDPGFKCFFIKPSWDTKIQLSRAEESGIWDMRWLSIVRVVVHHCWMAELRGFEAYPHTFPFACKLFTGDTWQLMIWHMKPLQLNWPLIYWRQYSTSLQLGDRRTDMLQTNKQDSHLSCFEMYISTANSIAMTLLIYRYVLYIYIHTHMVTINLKKTKKMEINVTANMWCLYKFVCPKFFWIKKGKKLIIVAKLHRGINVWHYFRFLSQQMK